ncbi:hypothetical protein F4861DRAFT_187779 [Xylaria intraflava]|nr:hypothetical protein F4861DRAFT_187779 [Xylaria intraflava]
MPADMRGELPNLDVTPQGPTPDAIARNLPGPSSCGEFDGDMSADRWLQRVKWEFRRAGIAEDSPRVYEIINFINMQCKGLAATFVDSSTIIQNIFARAQSRASRPTDLSNLESMLRRQFPARGADGEVLYPADEVRRLAQEPDESISSYYMRTLGVMRRMGARDSPRTPSEPPLTSSEVFMLNTVVIYFVSGLRNARLRAVAVNESARTELSLFNCFRAVISAQETNASGETVSS